MCVLLGFKMADFGERSDPPHIFVTRSISSCYWGANSFFFFFSLYFWLHWVFLAVRGLSLFAMSGAYSLVAVRGLLIPVVSLFLLWSTGSRSLNSLHWQTDS